MLPSEITGPGPGATRVDAYTVREWDRRIRERSFEEYLANQDRDNRTRER